jgi:copper homeostasis protein
MAKEILLEVAVACVERAIAAERAGAHRVELCASLGLDGLTPSLALARRVRAAVKTPVHVLIRPRPRDFVYTAGEFDQMKSEIAAFRQESVQGIVSGVLRPDHSVDVERTRELVALAAPLPLTFHRAFDETPSHTQALEDVIRSGATRILTSAGARSAADALPTLQQLLEQAGQRITILPGGGLHPGNLASIARLRGVRELHTGLGTVIPYDDPDTAKFESTVRACLAALQ